MKTIYRICAADGTFSSGGYFPKFTAKGKHWSTKSALSNHISQLSTNGKLIYARMNAYIVEYEVREDPYAEFSIDEWTNGIALRRNKRERGQVRRQLDRLKSQELDNTRREIDRLTTRLRQLEKD